MAKTLESKMSDRERELHRELTTHLANNNAALLEAQHERNRLVREIESYVREGRRIARHIALLEQSVERRYEIPLWQEEAVG